MRGDALLEPSEKHLAENISVADILAMKGTVIMILAYAPCGEPGRAPPYSTNNGKAALCMPTPKAVRKGQYNCTTDIYIIRRDKRRIIYFKYLTKGNL